MNARDRIYTDKVSKWGLPDGTVVFDKYDERLITDNGLRLDRGILNTASGYKIKSLPHGYEFNEKGEIVKVEQKRYWKEGEELEVGMIVLYPNSKEECEVVYCFNNQVCVKARNMSLMVFHQSQIKPTDTRTDKQKAVDYIVSVGVNKFIANAVIDNVIAGKIHGVKWVGEDD